MTTPFNPQEALIVVMARVHGPAGITRVRLALDTGATSSIVAREALELIGYNPTRSSDRVRVVTGSAIERAPLITVGRIEGLGRERRDLRILAYAIPSAAGVDGVLGLDFVRGWRLTIDFRAGLITLD